MFLPDPARGKVCLCPRLLSYFCLFLASSLRLVISVFSLRLHLSHLGVRGLVGRGTQLPEQYKSII